MAQVDMNDPSIGNNPDIIKHFFKYGRMMGEGHATGVNEQTGTTVPDMKTRIAEKEEKMWAAHKTEDFVTMRRLEEELVSMRNSLGRANNQGGFVPVK